MCMHVSTHVCTSARAFGEHRATLGVIPFLPSCYLRLARCMRLTDHETPGVRLPLPLKHGIIRARHLAQLLYMGSGDQSEVHVPTWQAFYKMSDFLSSG